jgi:pilus assembly protein CpaC
MRRIVGRDRQRAGRRVIAWCLAGALAVVGLGVTTAPAQPAPDGPAITTAPTTNPTGKLIADGLDKSGGLTLGANKSAVINTTRRYATVSVAQPDIAVVTPVSTTSFLVTAKSAGTTQIVVWDLSNATETIDVTVTFDLTGLSAQFKDMFPGADIKVSGANGQLILRGRVPTLQTAEQAQQAAAPYARNVINFLEVSGGQQVMLQVKLAEVSRNATNALGVNLGFTDGTSFGGSNIGQVSPFGILTEENGGGSDIAFQSPTANVTLFGRGHVGETFFGYFIEALRQNNLIRILAEPNLVAVSGQEASFLAGGEFPIPVPQDSGGGDSSGTITIEYREFGVRLRFVPVVLGDGNIRLKVQPEVSELDFTTAVELGGFRVPGLTKRTVETTVELKDGQTFAVAGLLNNSVTANRSVTPILGDVPILGALFRSVRYQRRQTELVVLVTPRLVEAMNPDEVTNLPGERWRHPEEWELFLGADIGGPETPAATTQPVSNRPAPRYRGEYGFRPAQ